MEINRNLFISDSHSTVYRPTNSINIVNDDDFFLIIESENRNFLLDGKKLLELSEIIPYANYSDVLNSLEGSKLILNSMYGLYGHRRKFRIKYYSESELIVVEELINPVLSFLPKNKINISYDELYLLFELNNGNSKKIRSVLNI